jgi:hypothetical protein
MQSRLTRTILSVFAVCLGTMAVAQSKSATTGPPKVLVIGREVVKMGQGSAHEKWEAGWPRAFAKAEWNAHYLAATSLTGESRALYLSGYDSMEAWEKDTEATRKNKTLSAELDALSVKDADFLKESRTGVFTYMPELSYQPDAPLAGLRYFRIFNILVKPGHDSHFVETRKLVREAHEKAGLKEHFAVYHIAGGGSAGQYLIFIPMQSLAEVDQFDSLHGAAYKAALGEEGQKKIADFNAQGVESTESNIFALNPAMSYPPKAWVDADPGFWTPKAAVPAKPAAVKKPAK